MNNWKLTLHDACHMAIMEDVDAWTFEREAKIYIEYLLARRKEK